MQKLFKDLNLKTPPNDVEVEISLFGKGFGECVVIHCGDSKYVVIDSFLNDETKRPVALDYLESMGVNFSNINLVVSTHWHGDHTNGLTEIINVASDVAKFVTCPIVKDEKFIKYIEMGNRANIYNASATREFSSLLARVVEGKISPKWAIHDRVIYKISQEVISHNKDVVLHSLSPQDKEMTDYLLHLNIPDEKAISAYSYPYENDLSVVIWMSVGSEAILLGGDLENKPSEDAGWKAIVKNHTLGNKKASIFKIPHHGSENAHNNEVWENLLIDKPLSILTVFNRCDLPSDNDKQRIKSGSSQVFVAGRNTKKNKDVTKMAKGWDIAVRTISSDIGLIRLRKNMSDPKGKWRVERFGATEAL